MEILAWNAEGEVCPLEDSKFFSASPSPHLSPLDTASNYPRKELLKAVQTGGFFSARKSVSNYQHENEQEVTMKIRKLFKRAAALALAAVTALSAVPATTAFAAGDIGTISFTHTYDGAGNAIRYNSSANIGGHTAGGTGEYKYRMYVDGETAFCLQPGVPLKTGNTLAKASSNAWNALSAEQRKA